MRSFGTSIPSSEAAEAVSEEPEVAPYDGPEPGDEDDAEYGAAVIAVFDALPDDLTDVAGDPRVIAAPVVFAARSVAEAVRYAVEGLVMERMAA